LEDISFDASEKGGEALTIDAEMVHRQVGVLAKDSDLSKFIL
jgi:ATP-dependent HslUV protease ATP-binding subunit HslU